MFQTGAGWLADFPRHAVLYSCFCNSNPHSPRRSVKDQMLSFFAESLRNREPDYSTLYDHLQLAASFFARARCHGAEFIHESRMRSKSRRQTELHEKFRHGGASSARCDSLVSVARAAGRGRKGIYSTTPATTPLNTLRTSNTTYSTYKRSPS